MRRADARPGLIVLLTLLTVPLAAQSSSGPGRTEPAAQGAAALPDARAVIERHIKAAGGRDVLSAAKSRRASGTIAMPATGLSGTVEIFEAAPNKTKQRMTLAGVGDVQQGYDGTIGWSIEPIMGPRLLQGRELEDLKEEADFHGDLSYDTRFSSMKTVERTEFDGRPCYKLLLVRRNGLEETHYYDVSTGLRAGTSATRETAMGSMPLTTVESDYRQFGRARYPTKLATTMMGTQMIITIAEVEFDKVDPAVFEPPAEIKALIK